MESFERERDCETQRKVVRTKLFFCLFLAFIVTFKAFAKDISNKKFCMMTTQSYV